MKPYFSKNRRYYSPRKMILDEIIPKTQVKENKDDEKLKFISEEDKKILYYYKNRDLIDGKEPLDDTKLYFGKFNK